MTLRKVCGLAAALLAVPGCNPHPISLREQLDSRYEALNAAIASKDQAAIRAVLADGFVSIDVRGKSEGTAEMIKEVLAMPANSTRHSRTTIVSVKGDDRAATVEQRFAMTQQTTGDDGIPHSVAISTLSRDRWVRDGGTWRIAQTATEKLDYAMDGVNVAHSENPAL